MFRLVVLPCFDLCMSNSFHVKALHLRSETENKRRYYKKVVVLMHSTLKKSR